MTMNVQYLLKAVMFVEQAAAHTPAKREREIIEGVSIELRLILQKWGVSIGKIMDEDKKHPVQQLRDEALKALYCLYIAVPEDVAKDVNTKVKTYIASLESCLSVEE